MQYRYLKYSALQKVPYYRNIWKAWWEWHVGDARAYEWNTSCVMFVVRKKCLFAVLKYRKWVGRSRTDIHHTSAPCGSETAQTQRKETCLCTTTWTAQPIATEQRICLSHEQRSRSDTRSLVFWLAGREEWCVRARDSARAMQRNVRRASYNLSRGSINTIPPAKLRSANRTCTLNNMQHTQPW